MWMQRLGYGHPGGVLPDPEGIKVARRQTSNRLYDGGTKQLLESILPVAQGGPNLDTYRFWRQMQSLDLGAVPISIAQKYSYDSYVATSPSTLDPTIGSRVAVVDDTVMYADDTILHWLREDECYDSFDFESPVLSIAEGICRTRRGVEIELDGSFKTVFTGTTMDAAHFNGKTAVLSPMGSLRIITDQGASKIRLPRGSKPGWARVCWESESSLLWSNRVQTAFVDTRSGSEQDRQIVFDYAADLQKVVDMSQSKDHNVFVLSTRELSWIDMRMRKRVLSWDHFFGDNDYSLKISTCDRDSDKLVLLNSQLNPFTTIYTFGNDDKSAVSLCDPYYVETWPTVMPQSAASICKSGNVELYSTVGDGGLFKQMLLPTDREAEGFSRSPPISSPSPSPPPCEQHDFDFTLFPSNEITLGFDNLYKWVVGLEQPDLPVRGKEVGTVLKEMGFTTETLKDYCYTLWIKPLQDQRLADRRKTAIDRIIRDLASYETSGDVELAIELTPEIQKMSDEWDAYEEGTFPDNGEPDASEFYAATQPETAHFLASQPAPLAQRFSSQPQSHGLEFSLSQPLPSSSQQKKTKKKAKKRKRTEGFG